MNTIINKSGLKAVIKHKGAELISLTNERQKEYLWQGNPEFWGKHSPILFPIVGTLKNNKYQYEGNTYELPRHGFARDLDFELVEKNDNSATFLLVASEQTLVNYPFGFQLTVKYVLDETFLSIQYSVLNHSNKKMPFSIGAHPAFALDQNFENYALAFESEENLISYPLENDLISGNGIPLVLTEKCLPLRYNLFERDALIFKVLNSRKIAILENEKPFLSINFESFNNLGIWTKKNAPFICIEPWLGYSDAFETSGNIMKKEGIQIINNNETFNCQLKINIL